MNENKNQNLTQDNVIEIDLVELFYAFKEHLVEIIIAALIGGVLFGAYSYFMIKPTYESQSSVYVMSTENAVVNLQDFNIGSQLTQDYLTIMYTRPVLEDCIDEMGLDWNYETLKKKFEVENPDDTRVLIITATDTDPARAKLIADTVATVSAQHISDIMEIEPPKVIETGEVNTKKVAPSNAKYALIGAIIGIVIVCAVVTVQVIFNDSITTAEDVSKYLELPVLASIPARREKIENRKNKNKRQKNRPLKEQQWPKEK